MDIRIVPVTELKPKLLKFISNAQKAGQEYVVTKNGKPAAVIMGFDEWEGWKETLEIMSDKSGMKRIDKSVKFFKRGGKGLTLDEVFGPKS
jgi:prevent-host-death family protein